MLTKHLLESVANKAELGTEMLGFEGVATKEGNQYHFSAGAKTIQETDTYWVQ